MATGCLIRQAPGPLLALPDIISEANTAKSRQDQREDTSESEVSLRDPGDGDLTSACMPSPSSNVADILQSCQSEPRNRNSQHQAYSEKLCSWSDEACRVLQEQERVRFKST